jgi:CSLREA domain-containing protein
MRAAVEEANALAGPDIINFQPRGPSDADTRTISLSAGAIAITDAVTINGASSGLEAYKFVLQGSGTDRIFTVDMRAKIGSVNYPLVVAINGLTLTNGNTAQVLSLDGGAIYSVGGTLKLENMWLHHNTARRYGGAVCLEKGDSHEFRQVTVSNNTAGYGGGIATRDSPLTLTNATLSANTANGEGSPANALGGGIYVHAGGDTNFNTVTLRHVTVAANSAGAGFGGGVAVSNGASQFRLGNTLIATNTATNQPEYVSTSGIVVSDGYNLIGDSPGDSPASIGGFSYHATDLRDQDPQLGALNVPQGGTLPLHTLNTGSAAIDKGKNFGVLIDQRGGLRPIDNPTIPNATDGDGSDIGAWEVGGMVVNSLGDEPDAAINGICETVAGNGVCTLRAAVQELNASFNGDSIYFTLPGSGMRTIELLTALPDIEKPIRIVGLGADQLTIKRSSAPGTPEFRIFTFAPFGGGDGSANVSGVTISNGLITGSGGGILIGRSVFATLDAVAVTDNHGLGSGSGAGIHSIGNLTIRNSTISGNTGVDPDSVFGYEAGGIYSNTADGRYFQLFNSTVSGNSVDGPGGGILVSNGFTNPASGIFNSTIAFNSCGSSGCGLFNASGSTGDTRVRVRSTIISNNTSTYIYGDPDFYSQRPIISEGYNLVGDRGDGDASGWASTDLPAGTNPLLQPLAYNGGPTQTHRLGAGSPAIDKGSATTSADQRGALRFDNPAIPNNTGGDGSDIGAVEMQQATGLTFKVQPSTAIAGLAITPAVEVQIVDETGTAAAVERQVTIALGANPTGATFSGTMSVASSPQGVATFGDLAVSKAGSGYTLVASADAGSVISNAFTVQDTPTQFEVTAPANATLGTSFNFTVTVRDTAANQVTAYRGTVAFTSDDGAAELPANYTFTSGDGGQHTFSATLNTPGTRTITVTDTAQSSLTGTSGNINVPPTTPGTPDLLSASDTGASQTDNITGDASPTFNITGVMNGATVDLLRDGASTPVATGTASGTGIELTDPNVAHGAHSYTVRQTLNGQTSATSGALDVTIDTVAPTAASAPDLQAGSDSGPSNSDNVTSAASRAFDISGTENGAVVELLRNGTLVASAAGNGASVTITDSGAVIDGSYTYTARQTDTAGNVSVSDGLSVRIDTGTPVTGVPDLQSSSDSGVSNSDDITKAGTLTFDMANTDNGATVELYRGTTLVASTTGNGGTVQLTDSSSLSDGSYSYTAKQTDAAGNTSSSAAALSVTIDKAAPAITGFTSAHASPTNDSPITDVSVSFSEGVYGFTSADVTLANGSLSNFNGADGDAAFEFDLTPASDGLVTADIAAGAATDRAGNATSNTGRFEITYDGTAPTVSITAVSPDPRNTSVSSIQIVFSEPVTGFGISDLSLARDSSGVSLTGATLTSSDNQTWTLGNLGGLTGAEGSYTLTLSTSNIADTATNALVSEATEMWLMDTTAPSVDISGPSLSVANSNSTVTYTVTYSDARFSSSTLSTDDITLNKTGDANATIAVSGTGTTRTVTLSSFTGNGTLGISIAAGTASDTIGNTAPAAGPSATFEVETTPPAVTIEQRSDQADPATSEPIHFTVVFTEPVADFGGSDITFSGTAAPNATATVTQTSPNDGTTYNVAVSGMTANGLLTTSINVDKAHDAAGNGNTASTSSDATVLYIGLDLISSFEVNSTADTDDRVCAPAGTGNGCTLREAILAANQEPGAETITLSVTGTINLTSELPAISGDVTINGPGATQLTVRRQASSGGSVDRAEQASSFFYRIFTIEAGQTVTISNLTISGGVIASGSGGGILNHGTLTVSNCILTGNSASSGSGGAIANENPTIAPVLFLINTVVTGNSAIFGGGIYGGGALTLVNSTVRANTATSAGGGIYATSLTLLSSTVSGNSAWGSGGGIYLIDSLTANNSTISGNTAGQTEQHSEGGGILNHYGAVVSLTNVTVTNNHANSSSEGGGGIFSNGQDTDGTGGLLLRNCIVAGNTGGDLAGLSSNFIDSSSSYNVIGLGGRLLPNGNGNQTGVTVPRLGPLASNGGPTETHLLLSASPATNAGTDLASLSGALTLSQTTFNVAPDAAAIPAGVGFTILVDSEQMIVTAKSSSALTVTRGANGTSPAAHADGAAINSAFDQRGSGFPRRYGNAIDVGAVEGQAGTPDRLRFSVQPSNSFANSLILPAVKVEIVDAANALTGSTAEVTLTRRGGSGSAFLTGTTTITAVNGTATFNNVAMDELGIGYTLRAQSTGFADASSDPFDVTSPATITGTKTVSGNFNPSGNITFTIVLNNSGPAAQASNPGNEFTDVLPASLSLVSASASSGTAAVNLATNTARWNGSIAKDGSVTVTIQATIQSNAAGTVTNQGSIAYDADGNGTNEASASTDDPTVAGNNNPTSFTVGSSPTPTPTPTPTATPTPTPAPTATSTPSATPIATATPIPTPTATAAPTATPTPSPTPTATPAQALNISTRLRVDTGDKVMIAGFIITGNASKAVVLRGMGPSLVNSGVPVAEVLNDPVLALHGPTGALILANDDWKESPQRAQIEDTLFQPTDDQEAVIVATLQPGAYTVILTGSNQSSGIGLVEIYDVSMAADSALANISTRGFVQTANSVMIGGFTLGGNPTTTRIAIRGLGVSLASSGLNPSNLLADPTLQMHDANGTIMIANDNWIDDPETATQLSAHGLAPPEAHESGIFASLPPGQFTVILAGKNGGVGIGLVEIYNLK